MPLDTITVVRGTAVPVPGDDIDTDRIIPARFMKCVTFDGLGEFLFYDARFDESGRSKQHPLDDPRFKGASILISGVNFGCGSSREHAPQALFRFGIRAVIADSFAEIFFGNASTLGMPCVCLAPSDLAALTAAVQSAPDTLIEVDLPHSVVRAGSASYPLSIPDGARTSLIHGQWDPIAELLDGAPAVDAVASRLAYLH